VCLLCAGLSARSITVIKAKIIIIIIIIIMRRKRLLHNARRCTVNSSGRSNYAYPT
jgi:hypothetical protein